MKMFFWSEHGAQYDLQGSAHPRISTVLQSRSVQQRDERRSAHLTAGHQHREQDCGTYRHLRWEITAGIIKTDFWSAESVYLLCIWSCVVFTFKSLY